MKDIKTSETYVGVAIALFTVLVPLPSFSQDTLSVIANTATITRGDTASLTCTASGGCPPYTITWSSWTKGDASAVKTGSATSVKALETCSVTITVEDSSSPPNQVTDTAIITVEDRIWNVVHSTDDDAWTDWGVFPFGSRGQNINQHTHSKAPIIGTTVGDWSDDITIAKIDDSNGPFDGYWYNSTHSLRVERETRINQYLKGTVGGVNWPAEQNDFQSNPGAYAPVLTATQILNGVKAHENQGNAAPNFNTSPKQGGHSALMKAKQDSDDQYNAALQVESLIDATSEASLESKNNAAIVFVDADIEDAADDPLTGNYHSYIIRDFNTGAGTRDIVEVNP
jgi:hypothetical protein